MKAFPSTSLASAGAVQIPVAGPLMVEGQLQGIISGHVDDFVFSGHEVNKEWNTLLENILNKYNLFYWKSRSFALCQVKVERREGGTYALSLKSYIEELNCQHTSTYK